MANYPEPLQSNSEFKKTGHRDEETKLVVSSSFSHHLPLLLPLVLAAMAAAATAAMLLVCRREPASALAPLTSPRRGLLRSVPASAGRSALRLPPPADARLHVRSLGASPLVSQRRKAQRLLSSTSFSARCPRQKMRQLSLVNLPQPLNSDGSVDQGERSLWVHGLALHHNAALQLSSLPTHSPSQLVAMKSWLMLVSAV